MDLFWDPAQQQGSGGGTIQTLQLSNNVLSLVPGGSSVVIPTTPATTIGPNLLVSTLTAQSNVFLKNNTTPTISLTGSNGTIAGSNIATTNATFQNTTTNHLSNSFAQMSNISASVLNVSTIQASNITTSTVATQLIYVSTITANIVNTNVLQNPTGIYLNTDLAQNSNNSLNAPNIQSQNISTNSINFQNNVLSNNATNLTYNGQNIYAGDIGNASTWSRYPATNFVNMNGQGIGGVNGLWVDNGDVNIQNNFENPPSDKKFEIGSGGSLTVWGYTQPKVRIRASDIILAAGDAVAPSYSAGRQITLDAFSGTDPFSSRNSQINLNAYGGHLPFPPPLTGFFNGVGEINLNAYAAVAGLPISPFSANVGKINLNGGIVNVGANNTTPFFGTYQINQQAYQINFIAGSELLTPFTGPATVFRSGNGIEVITDPFNQTESTNTDSVIRVKEIIAQTNADNNPLLPDPFGCYLTLDGRTGGITLDNFLVANGKDGSQLLNIGNITGTYATNTSNQIASANGYTSATSNNLQTQINAIVSAGGSNLSNIATWYQHPAISNVNLNMNMASSKSDFAISTINGVIITDYAGNLNPVKASQYVMDCNYSINPYDTIQFINNTTGSHAPIQVSSIILNTQGTKNTLEVHGTNLMFNNQQINTNYVAISSISSFTNINIKTINVDSLSTTTFYGDVVMTSSLKLLSSLTMGNTQLSNDANASFSITLSNNTKPFSCQYDSAHNIYQTLLSNVSTINGIPYTSGGGGVSPIYWSQYPVSSSNIDYGNKPIVIKGSNSCQIMNQDLTNYLPIITGGLEILNTNATTTGDFIIPTLAPCAYLSFNVNNQPTFYTSIGGNLNSLNVSTIVLGSNELSCDPYRIYVDGNDIIQKWADNLPTFGTGIVISNFNPITTSPLSIMNYDLTGFNITFNNYEINAIKLNAINTGLLLSPDNGNVHIDYATSISFLGGSTNIDQNSVTTDNLSVNTVITLQGQNLTADTDHLYFNGIAIDTSASSTYWATLPAVQQVTADYGMEISGSCLSWTMTSGNFPLSNVDFYGNVYINPNQPIPNNGTIAPSNFNFIMAGNDAGTFGLTLKDNGSVLMAQTYYMDIDVPQIFLYTSLVAFPTGSTSFTNDSITSFAYNVNANGSIVGGNKSSMFLMNGFIALDEGSGTALTGDSTNLYYGAEPLAFQSQIPATPPNAYLGYNTSFNYIGNGAFATITSLASFATSDTYPFLCISFVLNTPSIMVQNSSNYITIQAYNSGLNIVKKFNCILPSQTYTFTQETQCVSQIINFDTFVGAGWVLQMSASQNGVFSFSNVNVKCIQ